MRRILVGFVAVATLGVTELSGVAHGVALACGTTITQNTTLTADVGPCPAGSFAHGIIVGGDNITLDLNGHRVFASPTLVGEGAGVFVYRRTGVTVRNGTVSGFDGGVIIEGGGGNTVTGIRATENFGIIGLSAYGDGIAIQSSVNNRIVGNQAVNNGPFSGFAIYSRFPDAEHPRTTGGQSTGNLIADNLAADNVRARSQQVNDNDGIRIETQSEFNTITRNTVRGSGLDGIAIFSFTPNNTVSYNTVVGNGFLNPFRRRGDGIRVFGGSTNTTVIGNQVQGNAANGIIFHGVFNTPSGPRPPVTNSRATDNSAVGNAVMPPIEMSELGGPVFDLLDGNPGCDNNVWLRNRYRTAQPACTTTGGQQV